MKRTRPARRIAVLLGIVVIVLSVGAAAAPARELSTRVRVTGAHLKESGDVGSSADPAIGKPAPTLIGQGFDNKAVTFASDGKARILLFLSHSCPHCQAEVPRIVKLAQQGKLDGVEIDTVTTNTSKNLPNYPPSKWLRREHWPFSPVLADDSRLRALIAYGGTAFPFFVFVRSDGTIAARASGELSPATITQAAARLAAGTSLFAR